jgi:hypothetical protein
MQTILTVGQVQAIFAIPFKIAENINVAACPWLCTGHGGQEDAQKRDEFPAVHTRKVKKSAGSRHFRPQFT